MRSESNSGAAGCAGGSGAAEFDNSGYRLRTGDEPGMRRRPHSCNDQSGCGDLGVVLPQAADRLFDLPRDDLPARHQVEQLPHGPALEKCLEAF